MMFKVSSRVVAIAGLFTLLLTGCQTTPEFRVEQKPNSDIPKYQTFAVLPFDEHVPGSNATAMKAAVPVIEGMMRERFLSRGYREAFPDKADFVVVLNAGLLPKVNARDRGYIPGYVGSGWYSNYADFMSATSVQVDSYEETVIALQVFDSKTKEMVWVGFGKVMRKEKRSYSERLDKAGEALKMMIDQFPAAVAAK